MTTADPSGARRMCVLLAEFLRDSLLLGSEHRITIGRELRLAERFLEIERVRFGDRLRVELSALEDETCLVPPLLLQPIVENAVTHGVAHVIDGGVIRIALSSTAGSLTAVVENPCDADRPRHTGTGLGLANVRARLRALYGDDARMTTNETAGTWRVEIVLPAERTTLVEAGSD
jgi:LytS/YehU family sensor histidine kinase